MKKEVIVTGVNGFVGEHVARALKSAGNTVVGVGYDTKPNEKVAGLLDTYLSCDLLDSSAVERIDTTNTHSVIHLAGLSAVGQSFEQPRRYISDNALMTYNLLEKISKNPIAGRVVVVSSGALYNPNQPLPLSENSLVSASSPYAIGKLATEHVVSYFRNRGMQAVIARPFNHIGPGQGVGFLLPDLYQQLVARGEANTITVGNVDTKRDYTDVRDIVEGYTLLAFAESLQHEVYNLCAGRSLSGRQLLSLLKQAMQLPDITVTIDEKRVRPTDPADIYGSSARIRSELGWEPHYSIDQTVLDFVQSMQHSPR